MSEPRIFVVSGGMGTTGEQLARTALAQFEGSGVSIAVIPGIRTADEVREAVNRAAEAKGLLIHTLVDPKLRDVLKAAALKSGVVEIDSMGPVLDRVSIMLERAPIGRPGLYRRVREEYFRRIEAIEFAVRHDDGRYFNELIGAEIILIGVSRAGKTPLSMYLAMRGFKAANVPLVHGIEPPGELFEVPRGRVVGLTLDPDRLVAFRRQRQGGLGEGAPKAYSDPGQVFRDLEHARAVFRRGRFATVDVTSKPIEETANEVVAVVARDSGLDMVSRTTF
jgi:regulator of PEP synthase PpsR (kinase-PPPase family)